MSKGPYSSYVQFLAKNESTNCGYCKSSNTFCCNGMWASFLCEEDYQRLLDRGWRRSGRYCYKPVMDVTCCPPYTIRCAALEFSPSKSQKKTIKRFNHYITSGENRTKLEASTISEDSEFQERGASVIDEWSKQAKEKACSSASFDPSKLEIRESDAGISEVAGVDVHVTHSTTVVKEKMTRKAEDPSPSVPKQKKAKLLRKERKRMKLLDKGYTEEEADAKLKTKTPHEKSLEEFIKEVESPSPAHKLEIRLVQTSPPSRDFERTRQAAYEVYRKYQMAVHGDLPEKCSLRQYTRFLVDSPLQIKLVRTDSPELLSSFEESYLLFKRFQIEILNDSGDEDFQEVFTLMIQGTPFEERLELWKPRDGPPHGYGSFHQQYWLDGKLIAVGVLDILPKCVSSVYFYYDPDFAFLSLGTYGSLREISMVRSLNRQVPSIQFYYMGYYIHSCPKMRYKANYKPSYLLCPEKYTWHAIEECKPKLDQQKYCCLNPDPAAPVPDDKIAIELIPVFYNKQIMLYGSYKRANKHSPDSEDEEVLQYAKLVGPAYRSIYLFRD